MAGARKVIPGFRLTLGYTLFYLSLLVLIPLAAMVIKTTQLSWSEFVATITSASKVTFGRPGNGPGAVAPPRFTPKTKTPSCEVLIEPATTPVNTKPWGGKN